MKFENRIARKMVLRKVRSKFTRLFNATSAPSNQVHPFYKKVWKDIVSGLEFGYEPKYTLNKGDVYATSIEEELTRYHNEEIVTEARLNNAYEYTVKYIKQKVKKYSDLTLVESENEYGKYFQITFLN